MAKDVASRWIEKHASKEFCLTVFFPSYDAAVVARRLARFAVGTPPGKNTKIAKIGSATIVEGLDSMMILSNDETNMVAFRNYMEKLGFEVGWGW
jgi:hypothetical protein